MTVLKTITISLVGLIIIILLKKHSSDFSFLAEISVMLMLMFLFAPEVKELLSEINDLLSLGSVNTDILKILFKCFGILSVGAVVCDLCRDNGENALANLSDMFVKCSVLICAVPMFSAVIKIALSFLS